jgi:hypothetical protein
MAITITGARGSTAIRAPENAEDGDAADLVATTIQPIANNIADLRALNRVGTVAAMAAATGVLAGDTYLTSNGAYTATSGAASYNSPWHITCTGTAGIHWSHSLVDLLFGAGLSNGLARVGPLTGIDSVTPAGKIPFGHLTNPVLLTADLTVAGGLFSQSIAAGGSHTDTVRDIAGCVLGDVLIGTIGPLWVRSWGSTDARIQLEFLDNYTGVVAGTVRNRITISQTGGEGAFVSSVSIPFRHLVTVSGTTRIQIGSIAGNGILAVEGMDHTSYSLGTITIYRP